MGAVEDLRAEGIYVWPGTDGKVRFRPVTAESTEKVRARKAELLAQMTTGPAQMRHGVIFGAGFWIENGGHLATCPACDHSTIIRRADGIPMHPGCHQTVEADLRRIRNGQQNTRQARQARKLVGGSG